ncbi:unnamed protein product [Arabis nemorensis]|uniref:Arf-GAP domain-containing protein n=1 Tax=Arabis nemorensis TaxID=586526 RepID=A0A565CAS2_9BRAS|nr:unnamed protein product [Arabis nemorensis]
MGSRIKEDERIEKAIRSLLKLPENRRCINCNSLGPQYVCSTFWTFVCINCSGIHREFTHRVKSVSMAKFTSEEVTALRAGGNERARQIYFKEWDNKRDAYPDSSNIFKIRDFIKSVYVEKRYSSESNDKISPQKPVVIEEYRESRKAGTSFFGSRSLRSLDKSAVERPSGVGSGNETLKFYFEDKKHNQQHVMHNPKSRGLPKSPIRFEIVDDRFRDDGGVKRYDARRESRGSSKSLDLSNNKDTPSFPIVRHASEVLGDNAPRLRVENVVKDEKKKDKLETRVNLIDDVPVSEPCDDKIRQTSSEPLKTTENPAPNSLEALLFGLSVPSDVPGTNNYELWSKSDNISSPAANLGTQTMPRTPDSVTSIIVSSPTIAHAQSPHAGYSSPAFPVSADNLNTKELATPSVTANNQLALSTSPKGLSDTSMEQSTLDISDSAHGVGSEHHQNETKSSVRSALPEDLFTGGFSFASPQMHGQQHHGMGYGMQYFQYPVNTGAFAYTAKTSNPFDLSCDDTGPNQASQFPSMGYVQGGGLPQVSVPGGAFSDSSSPAPDSVVVMASQSPFYTSALSPNSPSPGETELQEMNGLGSAENTYNAAHAFHQAPNNGYPCANPNAYISRGNPFD